MTNQRTIVVIGSLRDKQKKRSSPELCLILCQKFFYSWCNIICISIKLSCTTGKIEIWHFFFFFFLNQNNYWYFLPEVVTHWNYFQISTIVNVCKIFIWMSLLCRTVKSQLAGCKSVFYAPNFKEVHPSVRPSFRPSVRPFVTLFDA